VQAVVQAPSRPGHYILWWDLVHEHTTWFGERGNVGLREMVEVRGDEPTAKVPSVAVSVVPSIGESTPVPRRSLWQAAMKLFFAHPITGIGPDNFRHRFGPVLGLAPTDVDERLHANSLYLETLADLGVVGCLAFGLLGLATFRTARRASRAPATRFLALGVAAALGAYLLHGVLDYFLEFTPTYAQFWLLAGMMAALDRCAEAVA
jgi:O-antigen ligase